MQILIFPLSAERLLPSGASRGATGSLPSASQPGPRIKIAEADAPRTDHDVYAMNDLPPAGLSSGEQA
jgi:hypothetical protein